MGSINLKKVLSSLLMFSSLSILSAQTLDLQTIPSEKKQFGLSFDKTFYSSAINMSTLSGVYQIYFNVPVSSKLNLTGNIPYINTSYDINYGFGQLSYSKNGLGNVFIGLQIKPEITDNRRSIYSFGIFLPTASEQASFNGAFADYYYMSKYIPNSIGLYFNYAFHKTNAEGFSYGLELGPNLLFPTKSRNFDTEFFAHYGIITGYQVNKLLLNLELIGVVIISENIYYFGDRFVNMINMGAQLRGSTITPRVFYKIYLREAIRNNIDGVLGLGVNVFIN